jgi:hypothetical protein
MMNTATLQRDPNEHFLMVKATSVETVTHDGKVDYVYTLEGTKDQIRSRLVKKIELANKILESLDGLVMPDDDVEEE